MGRVKRIWYLSPKRAAKVQASLRIRAVSPEPSLLAHTSSESRGTFRQKARSLAPLNGWACAVKICYDGMLEDTDSLNGAQVTFTHVHIFIVLSRCAATPRVTASKIHVLRPFQGFWGTGEQGHLFQVTREQRSKLWGTKTLLGNSEHRK